MSEMIRCLHALTGFPAEKEMNPDSAVFPLSWSNQNYFEKQV